MRIFARIAAGAASVAPSAFGQRAHRNALGLAIDRSKHAAALAFVAVVGACAPFNDPAPDDGVPDETAGSLATACADDAALSTTANLGEAICQVTVGRVQLKLALPAAGDAPSGLAVFLHGDTANGWFEDFGYEYLIDATRRAGLVLAAPLAPNQCSWWRDPTECDFEVEDVDAENADALAEALDRVRADFAIDEDADVRFVGYSGGSTFLTGHFIPLYGDRFFGPMVANCGGEIPIYDFAWRTADATLRGQQRLTFTLGSDDFMAQYVDPAVTEYTRLGFDVDHSVLDGFEHCDAGVDWDTLTLSLWSVP